MPRRQFNADLALAMAPTTNLRSGFSMEKSESDGELVVTYTAEALPAPFRTRIMCSDLDEYPRRCQYMLFTDDEDPPERLTKTYEDVQFSAENLSVLKVIDMLSTALIEATDEDGDVLMTDIDDDAGFEDDYDAAFDDEDELDLMDDDVFGRGTIRHTLRPPAFSLDEASAAKLSRRIKRDFRKVREAGFKVSILQGMDAAARSSVASMSIKASKLGLSEEALQAWDIKTSDYVILLLRVDGTYPILEKLLEQTDAYKEQLSFRIGKCDHYKPTLQDALLAFNATNVTSIGDDSGEGNSKSTKGRFLKTLVSTSLDQFMTEHFTGLTKLRRSKKLSWHDANEEMIAMMSRPGDHRCVASEDEEMRTVAQDQANVLAGPRMLHYDHLMDEGTPERSLPLVAMNFAMEYFVNCAKYCLRCHRKVYDDFGALKPYVCSDPLCLFQYMTMGMGPSTEHEILAQPKVVDLLVSFCYQALGSIVRSQSRGLNLQSSLLELPVGLRVKAPSGKRDARQISGHLDFNHRTFTLSSPDKDMELLQPDQWVVLAMGKGAKPSSPAKSTDVATQAAPSPTFYSPSNTTVSNLYPPGTVLQAQIKTKDFPGGTVEIEISSTTTNCEEVLRNARCSPESRITDVHLLLYDTDMDDLAPDHKLQVMKFVLDSLPSITSLRNYLKVHPEKKIRDVPQVTPAAATLLEWIVASNRSCIVQTGDPNDADESSSSEDYSTGDSFDPTLISGMAGYTQFRFAQGSPDKEIRFNNTLQDVKKKHGLKHETLFAWHGSPLGNWHSIVRTGLNYNVVSHGRAFGDGVYFSNHFATSSHYTTGVSQGWPSSELKVGVAISLNEIINLPTGYKSSNPHYVVDNLDWFQTRFLFVKSYQQAPVAAPSISRKIQSVAQQSQTHSPPIAKTKSQLFYAQDATRIPFGSANTPIQIPLAAMPSSRVERGAPQPCQQSTDASDSGSEDSEDAAWLLGDEEEHGHLSGKSSVDSLRVRELTTKRPVTPTVDPSKVTKFNPGSLDLSTLPLMAPPAWANSSAQRGISAELKKLQAVQASSALPNLGFYIDFDNIDNLFQWIVELHSFELDTPLGQDMRKAGVESIVCEVRFGAQFPFTPPFLRVIRPRFLPFASGGGGHVTAGGAMCMELLTTTGWSPANAIESVLVQVRLALLSNDPKPARLDPSCFSRKGKSYDYSISEAIDAYKRAAAMHGWEVPEDFDQTAIGGGNQTASPPAKRTRR